MKKSTKLVNVSRQSHFWLPKTLMGCEINCVLVIIYKTYFYHVSSLLYHFKVKNLKKNQTFRLFKPLFSGF